MRWLRQCRCDLAHVSSEVDLNEELPLRLTKYNNICTQALAEPGPWPGTAEREQLGDSIILFELWLRV